MKRLSTWARAHAATSRFLIVCIYILLNISGLFVGDILNSMGFTFNPIVWFVIMITTLMGVFIYPSRKLKSSYKNFYKRQKFADGILITSTFFFIIYFGNTFGHTPQTSIASSFAVSIMNTGYSSTNVVASKKEVRKNLRQKIKEIRKQYKQSTKGQKTLYIILAILAAAGLIYLMLGLSCSIACSGSEALAYIVGGVGIGAIIFGLVKLIQRITRGKRVVD